MDEFVNQLKGPMLYLLLTLLALAAIKWNWLENGKHAGIVKLMKWVLLALAAASLIASISGYDQLTLFYALGQLILSIMYVLLWIAHWVGEWGMALVKPYMTWWKP